MKKVTILAPCNTMATTVFGPMDILTQAGRLWNRIKATPPEPFFEVAIASADGRPIRCTNNVLIQPHCSLREVEDTDLIIIASATGIDKILADHPKLVPWLCRHYRQGAHIASICTGVFLLAETGLLDGRSATLHWGFTELFRERYPQIRLEQDRMFLDHGRLYCSAGVSAGMDLALHLVEKFCGRKAAMDAAKTMVLDPGRERQTPYERFVRPRAHGDTVIIRAQEWIEAHQAESIDYNALASRFRMSRRSLERRFKKAVGLTPLAYLQKLRVDQAKHLLEEGTHTFNEITYAVGYEDIPFFRKLFIRLTGMRPRAYQQRFGG